MFRYKIFQILTTVKILQLLGTAKIQEHLRLTYKAVPTRHVDRNNSVLVMLPLTTLRCIL